MKAVSLDGNEYFVYKDNVTIHNKIPLGVYHPRFKDLKGWWLEKDEVSIELREEMYSDITRRADHIYRGCMKMDRNVGVLLSGDKGLGKSMCATYLCTKFLNDAKLPIIMINEHLDGLTDFLNSITEPVVIMFDEYDKNYEIGSIRRWDKVGNKDEPDKQENHLSLFNGVQNSTKKIFILTCNDLNNISQYFINRTGRFHYHIRFEYPSSDDIKKYLLDHVKEKYHDQIQPVLNFSVMSKITFDNLRAIVFELNDGLKFNDFIEDLNILPLEYIKYIVNIIFEGDKEYTERIYLNLFKTTAVDCYFYNPDAENYDYEFLFRLKIPMTSIKIDSEGNLNVNKPYEDYLFRFNNKVLGKKPIIKELEIKPEKTDYTSYNNSNTIDENGGIKQWKRKRR